MAKMWTFERGSALGLGAVAGAAALLCASFGAQAQTVKDSFSDFEQKEYIPGTLPDAAGSAPVIGISTSVGIGFEGPSQYNAASFGRNFTP